MKQLADKHRSEQEFFIDWWLGLPTTPTLQTVQCAVQVQLKAISTVLWSFSSDEENWQSRLPSELTPSLQDTSCLPCLVTQEEIGNYNHSPADHTSCGGCRYHWITTYGSTWQAIGEVQGQTSCTSPHLVVSLLSRRRYVGKLSRFLCQVSNFLALWSRLVWRGKKWYSTWHVWLSWRHVEPHLFG